MDVILDNLPRNGTNIKCTFPQCNRIFPFPMAGVVHLGVEHGVAKSLMDLKTHDLSQVVSRPLNCPLKSCKYAFKDKKDLLRHLNAHFESHMSNEISKLQEIQFVPRTHCPCSGCNYSTEGIVKDDSLVVNELLLDHYAGVHGASIDILRSLDEKVIRPEINLQTMAELIPDRSSTPLKCPKCLKKKGKTMFYCDESAWLLHISSCHEQEDLKRMEAMYFHTNQPETAAKCKICDKVVAPKLRFLHIGVHHIHAKSLTQRFMKAEDAKMQKQRTLQGTGDGGGVSQTVPSLQGTAVGAQKSFPPMYFQCPKCSSKIFSSTETESRKVLLRHIILIHYLDELTALVSGKFPRCPVLGCEYSANSETELRKHFLTHLDKVLQVIQVKIRDFSFESCLRKLPENENKDDDDEVVVLDDSASGPSITSVTSLAPAAGMAPTTPSQTTEKEAISKRVKIVYQEFASYCHDKRVTMKTCVPTDLTSFLDKHFLTDDKTIDQYSSRVLTGFIFIVDQLLDKDEHGNSFSSNRLVAASITGVKKAINYKLSGNHHNNSAAETAATPNSDSSSRDGKSKKPQEDLFLCDHCQGRFSSVGKLKMHMFMIKLFNIKVSCVFCSGSNGFCVQGPWEKLEESCSLHIVSRSHQFNRCLKLQSGGGPMQENFRKPGLDGFCEACAEAVNGWHEHKTTKKHKDNVREVDSFVEYCNFRGISSVTCAVSDVKFYLDFVYPRTLQHSDVNIHQILFILSRIHDPVDGNDLYCINEINSHLQGLMRQTDPKRFSFICYSCPAGFNDMTELMKHASSLGHKSIVKTRSQRSFKNFFNCLACKRHFDSVLLMKIHEHERCHVKNSYFYSRNFDRFQREVEDRDDSLCTLCGVRCRGESHFNEEPHKSYQPLAENYIKYCLEKNKEPTSCGADFVETYFKTIVYSSPRLAQEASSTMSILNRLHDPIENDITIGKSPRFQALVESLKKMKQKPSIQSSSNRSSSSSRENREDKKTEKRPPYEESLSLEVADKLTRCLKCNEKFEHVTGLLYHLTKVHNSKAISHIIQFHNKGEEVHCEKCTKKCLSPIVYALHHDRHHLSSEFIKCPTCQYSYVSPSNFYYKDFCGDNNLSKEVKKEIESAITNLTMSGGSKPLGSCLMANLKKAAASGSLKRPRQELEDDYFSVEENIASSSPTKKRSKIKKVRSRGFLESSDEDEEIKEGDDDYIPNMEEDVDDPEPFEGDEEEEDGVENTNELPISKFGRKDRKLTRRDYPKVAISKALRDQAEKALNQDLRLTVSNNSSSSSPAINVPSSAVVQDEFVPDPPPAKRQRTISSSSSVSNASSRASKRASRPPVAANPPVVPRLVSPEKSKPSSMKVEKPSRASSVSSVKSENNASSSVKPKLSDATPAVKSEPSSSSGKPVAKPDLLFFCLDCEGCKDKSCNHRSHPRVFVGDQAAVKAHIRETMHTRLQTAKDFLQLGKTVSLKDLAYCQTYGHKVRKQFKKGVTTNMIEARRYPEKRQCKWKNCQYMADNVVTAFRHIRNEHLITKVKGEKDE